MQWEMIRTEATHACRFRTTKEMGSRQRRLKSDGRAYDKGQKAKSENRPRCMRCELVGVLEKLRIDIDCSVSGRDSSISVAPRAHPGTHN